MCATCRICSFRSEKFWLTACRRGRVGAGPFSDDYNVLAAGPGDCGSSALTGLAGAMLCSLVTPR